MVGFVTKNRYVLLIRMTISFGETNPPLSPGKGSIATAEDLQDYEDRKREVEEEIERRKRVGADVGKVRNREQIHLKSF